MGHRLQILLLCKSVIALGELEGSGQFFEAVTIFLDSWSILMDRW
jgi:hypothetical protein